jgi:hypothetical protein
MECLNRRERKLAECRESCFPSHIIGVHSKNVRVEIDLLKQRVTKSEDIPCNRQ